MRRRIKKSSTGKLYFGPSENCKIFFNEKTNQNILNRQIAFLKNATGGGMPLPHCKTIVLQLNSISHQIMSYFQILLDLAKLKQSPRRRCKKFTRTDAIFEFSSGSQVMGKCPATGDNPINSLSQTPQTEPAECNREPTEVIMGEMCLSWCTVCSLVH